MGILCHFQAKYQILKKRLRKKFVATLKKLPSLECMVQIHTVGIERIDRPTMAHPMCSAHAGNT